MSCLQNMTNGRNHPKADKGEPVEEILQPHLPVGTRNYFICKSMAFTLVFFAVGCQFTNIGICLPELIKRTNSNYASVASALSIASLSFLVVSPVLACVMGKFPKRSNLVIAFGCIVGALFYAMMPIAPSVEVLGVLRFISVTPAAIVNNLVPQVISSMWRERAAFPLHLVTVGFPLGQAVTPLISKSFISRQRTQRVSNESLVNLSLQRVNTDNFTEWSVDTQPSRIEIPFIIFANLMLLVGVCFLIFDFLERGKILIPDNKVHSNGKTHDKPKASFLETMSPRNWAGGDFTFGLLILIGTTVYLSCFRGHTTAFSLWGFSFAIESDLKFEKEEAAYLISTANIMLLVSRVVTSLCSLLVPVHVILFTQAVATTLSFTLLSFGLTSHTALWVYFCVYRLFASSMWATMMSWLNNYVSLTVVLIGWASVISSLVDLGTDNLIGYLLHNIGQMSLMYVCLGLTSVGLLSAILLQILASRHAAQLPEKTWIEDRTSEKSHSKEFESFLEDDDDGDFDCVDKQEVHLPKICGVGKRSVVSRPRESVV